MLSMFEVRDLPREAALWVLETALLGEVARAAAEQSPAVVLVMEGCGRARGVVNADSIRRVARHAPDQPVGSVATMQVVEVAPTTCLVDAVRAVSAAGVGALLVRDGDARSVITRDALLAFDSWAPLLAARSARLAKALDDQPPAP